MEKSSARGNSGSSPSSGGYSIGDTPDKKRLKKTCNPENRIEGVEKSYINENFRNTMIFYQAIKVIEFLCGEKVFWIVFQYPSNGRGWFVYC
jgi:hypothetical protein